MAHTRHLLTRIVFILALGVVGLGLWYGLERVNASMEVRYQAVGRIFDSSGKGVEGVEVVLTLSPPPPPGPARDALFFHESLVHQRAGAGKVQRAVGPVVGLSGPGGGVVVRATGRLGPAHAIRMGLDTSGRPPYEVAWLLLRKEGYADIALTISILGWRLAPDDWGSFANRLPRLVMGD